MDDLIESIRTAVADGASDDARHAGVHACRTILLALDTKKGEPLAQPVTEATSPLSPNIVGIIGALRGVPLEQLLDLAIAKLRTAVPAGAEAQPVHPIRFNLVPVKR